jgi:predicted dehydrogenase
LKPIRIAVVGVGHLGRIHARLLAGLPEAQLVGVCDPHEPSRAEVAATYRVAALADHRELVGRVDAAVVAAPTRYHTEVARELLAAGIHLLVEKPLAPSAGEAAELVEAARRGGLVLAVGHVERFNPAFVAAQAYLREPKYIEATRRGGFSFRSTDIGAVLDLMVHDIDLVLSLVRSPLRRVEALGISLFGEHEDVVNARLTFANGCVAALSASRASHTAARTMQVWSRHGFAALDFAARTASAVCPSDRLLARQLDIARMSGDEQAALKDRLLADHLPVTNLPIEAGDPLTAELTDFLTAVRTGRAPRVSGAQGLEAVEAAQRILSEVRSHAWNGSEPGPIGPRLVGPSPLRGPHWGARVSADDDRPARTQRAS